jgi:hypothetical protein
MTFHLHEECVLYSLLNISLNYRHAFVLPIATSIWWKWLNTTIYCYEFYNLHDLDSAIVTSHGSDLMFSWSYCCLLDLVAYMELVNLGFGILPIWSCDIIPSLNFVLINNFASVWLYALLACDCSCTWIFVLKEHHGMLCWSVDSASPMVNALGGRALMVRPQRGGHRHCSSHPVPVASALPYAPP